MDQLFHELVACKVVLTGTENAEIVARERGLKQRKVLEGIESLRQRHYGMRVLNNFDHVDTWKPMLNSFFYGQKNCKRR